jgi:predicted phage terminase large subunit-like protein
MTADAWTDKSEIHKRIDLPGGGSISVRSADDPNSLRGPGLDGCIIDEAAFLSVDAWENAIRPALSDKQGWCLFISTPNGYNWIHKLYRNAGDRNDWNRWQCPSSDNPLITKQELEEIRLDIGPRRFAQEHEAKFMEVEGALWPASYFEDHIYAGADEWPDVFQASVIAIDPAIAANAMADFSAIVFVGMARGKLWVDCKLARCPPLELVRHAVAMSDRYNPIRIGIESNAFQAVLRPLFDGYCREHRHAPLPLSLINNHEKKQVRIQRLDPYLANRQIRMHPHNPDCKILVEQLMMFPNKGYHDDGPDALEMAIRLIRHITTRTVPPEEVLIA